MTLRPMCIHYKITISIDLGEACPSVGAFLKELNTGLAEFGVNEKLMVRSQILQCNLTSTRELTEDEQNKVKTVLLEELAVSYPAWNTKIESFRRQSGNVEQLVTQ